MLELKVRQGASHRFWLWPPTPASAAPILAIRHPTLGTLAPVMTRAGTTATVSVIGPDFRTLTVGAIGGVKGLQGDRGGYAWLKLESAGAYPVRVGEVTAAGTSIVLTEPLPRTFAIGNGGTLTWQSWSAALTAVDVTSVVQRSIPYTATWEYTLGGDMPTEYDSVEGLLHVVRRPFATGLTVENVLAYMPSLSRQVPSRQDSWMPQADRAHGLIMRRLRADLRLRYPGTTEDNTLGPAFVDVHALLTVGIILAGHTGGGAARAEPRDDFREQAWALYDQIMLSVPWLDLDGDGLAEVGETDLAILGPSASWVGGFFGGADSDFDATAFPAFTRHQRH